MEDFFPRINTDFHGGGWFAQALPVEINRQFVYGRGRTRFPLIEIGFSRMEDCGT